MSTNRQTTSHSAPITDAAEAGFALEDAGGLSAVGFQKQASVRFSSLDIALAAFGILEAQWRDTAQFALAMALAASSDSGAKAESPAQSLVATVDALVGVTEDQFLASLTADDHQQLVAARDKLIDVVGADENPLCAPLIDFIGNIVEEYEKKMDMARLPEPQDKEGAEDAWDALLRSGPRGIEAAYGEDEYDYAADHEESVDAWDALLRLGPRGIEAAYGEDEHDHTADLGR